MDEIVVRGQARTTVRPDRAVLTVVVDGQAVERERAYADAGSLAAAVDAVLAMAGAAVERALTDALVVAPTTRWHEGEELRTGWRASRRTTAVVVDAAALGVLVADLNAAGAAVHGPAWEVDDANPVHDEVRAAAATDARRRAEAYARGLGVVLGRVRWMAEPGLRLGDGGGGPRPMAMARVAMAAESADIVEVQADDVVIEAAVEVGFALDT